MRKFATPIAALLAFTSIVVAAPPEGANPLFKKYFQSLYNRQNWGCCDIADCGEVEMEMRKDGPWVFIDTKRFGTSAPNDWVKVPASAYGTHIITENDQMPPRPPGAVACWFPNEAADSPIRCFDWPLPKV